MQHAACTKCTKSHHVQANATCNCDARNVIFISGKCNMRSLELELETWDWWSSSPQPVATGAGGWRPRFGPLVAAEEICIWVLPVTEWFRLLFCSILSLVWFSQLFFSCVLMGGRAGGGGRPGLCCRGRGRDPPGVPPIANNEHAHDLFAVWVK
jgi:hypothetical protein